MPYAPPQHHTKQTAHKVAVAVATERERNRVKSQFYGSALWRKFRLQRLAEQPLCQFCLQQGKTVAATDVDHILDRVKRPELALDAANVRCLCHPCHSRRTAQEQALARDYSHGR